MKYALLIEDRFEDAYIVEYHLVKMGYLVTHCDNPFKAIELVKTGKVDVVVTDINIPEMSGYDIIKHIRGTHSKVPIVCISCMDDEDSRIEAMKAGADYYLCKPINSSDMKAVFSQYIRTLF